ncbi:MAG: hypothetical protein JRF34_06810 [Deltaproteobacteria bacterium]|nr:hypothetical protein [Deltaproteobacteria bacterium]
MKERKFTWKAFLTVFASVILALGLVGCNGESKPPTAEHPEQPAAEGTKSEHPEQPKAEETHSEHPEHPE